MKLIPLLLATLLLLGCAAQNGAQSKKVEALEAEVKKLRLDAIRLNADVDILRIHITGLEGKADARQTVEVDPTDPGGYAVREREETRNSGHFVEAGVRVMSAASSV